MGKTEPDTKRRRTKQFHCLTQVTNAEKDALSNMEVCARIKGKSPIVVVSTEREPPDALLPADASKLRPKTRSELPLSPELSEDTLQCARAAAIAAPAAWSGLGLVPEELKCGFHSLLVLGPSGSGKTSLLRALLAALGTGDSPPLYPCGTWQEGEPLIQAFATACEGRALLSGVGLSSVPSWCKPYSVLSVGEKYRANVAQALAQRRRQPGTPSVFDEWTCELDRNLARVVSLAMAKHLRRELAGVTSAEQRLGPYIFATCHEDVAQYLQPELLCYCAVGQAPRVVRNPHRGEVPSLRAVLRGEVHPPARRGGIHHFCGHWLHSDEQESFYIKLRMAQEADVFTVSFRKSGGGHEVMAGEKIEWFRKEVREDTDVFPWYAGDCGNGMRVRMRLRTPNTMVLQYQHPRGRWQPAVDATRMSVMSSLQVPLMSRDPHEAVQNRMMSYHSFDVNDLQSVGWFVPPELTRDQWYSGLIPSSEPLRISASDVCWDPRFETVEDKSYYLTTYVGQPDGSLGEQLSNISDLLDGPFNGLCVHQVPTLPRMGKFTVGFVTGPSGSGKTTLARRLFGFPLEVEWASDVPVLGHFASLTRAREFCGAAQLDLHIAMRPFRSLSGGEQARAQVARLLHEGERRSRLDLGSRTPLLLEEFTSLMDRTSAKLLAREVQRLARRYKLQIVVLSCHRDFVAAGLMEPTWIFECDTNLLRRFRDMARPENRLQVVSLDKRLMEERAKTKQCAAMLEEIAQKLASSCFSQSFRTWVLHGVVPLGQEEMRQNRAAVAQLQQQRKEALAQAYDEQEPEQDASFDHSASDAPASSAPLLAHRPPRLVLVVRRALPREWVHYREHHYKDHRLSGQCICFVGCLEGRPACFTSIVPEAFHFVRRGATCGEWPADHGYPEVWVRGYVRRFLFREHRTVVLPDYQGIGLGPLLCDTVARCCLEGGHDFTSQTIHPFYGSYRERSPFWRPLPSNGRITAKFKNNVKFSHFFVGSTLQDGSEDRARKSLLDERVPQVCQSEVPAPSDLNPFSVTTDGASVFALPPTVSPSWCRA